ncbi:MAG: sulfite exporter TauE/SafE family protein [Bacteroidales bacterium]
MVQSLSVEIILLIVLVGFVSGYINTLAGSGSLITLPLLIFLGLPANVANGTNRIAIFLQNIVGVGSFYQQKQLNFKTDGLLAIPAILGALFGASIAADLDEALMEKVIGLIIIGMLILLLLKPNQFLKPGKKKRQRPRWYSYIIFFAIGIYGGFIQAGAGLFILMGLSLSAGYDLVRANAVKLLIVLVYTPFALYIFFINEQVHLVAGLILAAGSMGGALLASRMAVKHGAGFVRYVLLAIMLFSAIKLLFF